MTVIIIRGTKNAALDNFVRVTVREYLAFNEERTKHTQHIMSRMISTLSLTSCDVQSDGN